MVLDVVEKYVEKVTERNPERSTFRPASCRRSSNSLEGGFEHQAATKMAVMSRRTLTLFFDQHHHHHHHHHYHHHLQRRCLRSIEAILVAAMIVLGSGTVAPSTETDFGAGSPLRYTIQEQCPYGTVVGDLTVDAGLRRRYPADVLSQLEFRIMTAPPLPFAVDLKTGVIRTGGVIDRDSLMQCKDRELCDVSVDVTVRPTQFFQIIKTVVQVDDVNDNEPYFRDPEMTISIRESAAVDTSFSLPLAADLDSPKYGVVAYELMTDTADLGLKVVDRGDRFMDVRLVVQKELDRETRDAYRMQLVAYDGGTSPKSAQTGIVVHVLDSNDHSPVFERSSYLLNITENIAAGTVITRVRATDRDAGLNAEIVYGFSGQTQAMYGHLFAVRNRSGEILVTGDVDYEATGVYQLAVIAEDRGPDSMPTDAAVVIRVQDVNDNAPAIVVSTLTTRRTDVGEVSENLAPGTFVAHVSVVDRDSGDFGRVTCNISDPASFDLVERYQTELQIVTAVTFDRETQDLYDLTLVCWDGGLPPLVAEKRIPVRIADANDHPPQFRRSTYTGRIVENTRPEPEAPVMILRVEAVDADAGRNGEFHYALMMSAGAAATTTAASPFDVNEDGSLVARTMVDREQHSTFTLTVLAIDHGSPSLTGTALVLILVDDVNDEAPTFRRSSYTFGVPENRAEGTPVGRVSAEDRDLAAPDNTVRYSLVDAAAAAEKFAVDPETGEIFTTAALDRETQSVYRFAVRATDDGAASLTGTATVTVYVQDENDHDPVFVFPAPGNDTVSVSNRLPIGHVVAHVTATDRDLDGNGRVTYEIRSAVDSEDDAAAFALTDPQNGQITVNVRLDHLEFREYRLLLRASDGASPRRSSEAVLRVHVNSSIPYVVQSSPSNDRLAPKSRSSSSSSGGGNHLLIVVLLVSASSVATVALVVLIVVAWGRRRRRKKSQRYKSRMEALRALTAKEMEGSAGSPEVTPLTTVIAPCNGQTAHSNNGGPFASAVGNGGVSLHHTQSAPSVQPTLAFNAVPECLQPPPPSSASTADSGTGGHSGEDEDHPDRPPRCSTLPPSTRNYRFDLPPPPPPLVAAYYPPPGGRRGPAARGGTGAPADPLSSTSSSPLSRHLLPRCPRLLHSPSDRRGVPSGRLSPPSSSSSSSFPTAGSSLCSTVPLVPLRLLRRDFRTQSTVTKIGEETPDFDDDPVTTGCSDVIL